MTKQPQDQPKEYYPNRREPGRFESRDAAERQNIVNMLPQVAPFRFIDRIVELSSESISAEYQFRGDEWFYQGHFPGDPVTPGVILIEAMAQTGLVALGLFLLSREQPARTMRTLFTESSVEFLDIVKPGEKVIINGERLFWRRNKLRSNVALRLVSGKLIAMGTVSGMGVEA